MQVAPWERAQRRWLACLKALGIDPVLHNRLFELALCKSWTAAVKARETERAALISERLPQLPLR